MPVIACPHCRTKLEGRDAVLGKEVICGQCHKRFIAATMIPFGSQHARPESPEHQQDSRQDSRQGGPVSTEFQIGDPAKAAEHSSAQVPRQPHPPQPQLRQPHPPGPQPQPGPPQVLEEADAESMKPLTPSPARPYAPAKPPSPAKTSALVNPPAAARFPRSAQAPAQPMAEPLRNEPPQTRRIGRAPTPGKPIGYRAPGAALLESPLVGMTLVMGIFAIIGAWGCWGIVGLVCGPLAIMFGNAALKGIDSGRFAASDRGKASVGRNLGIVALAISILTFIFAVSRVFVR